MKTKVYITITLMAFIAITAVFWIQSCRKPVGTIDITIPTTKLLLKGKVIDNTTKLGIANAIVTIKGIAEVNTDKDGVYTIEEDVSNYKEVEIYAKASGYGLGSTKAYINKEQICVNSIPLKKLNTPVTIGPSGGKIKTNNNEGFKTNKIELIIPANAFSSNVNISVTPFEGIGVPGLAPDSMLNLVTVHLESDGENPTLPLKLFFPLPFSVYLFDSLPVLIFNQDEFLWQYSGHYAQIDKVSGMAISEIESMGTFSLVVAGSYNEVPSGKIDKGSKLLDKNKSSYEYKWLAKVEYPNGIPDSISPNWLKNVVSQNTHFANGRVSFFDSTYTTINYIPYKPDSVSTLKSTNGCIWVYHPKACWEDQGHWEWVRIYRWTDLNGNGIYDLGEPLVLIGGYWVWNQVWKIVSYDCGYWECIHDQGGGK